MQEITIERQGFPDITFVGEQLAQADTSASLRAKRSKRWTQITLYRNVNDRFVLCVTGMSAVPGEVPLHTVKVLTSIQEVVEELKFSWPAKEIYKQLGLDLSLKL